jgi:hypothetical protein
MAKGAETSFSDIDLMVIGSLSLMEVVSAVSGAERELGREVNPSVYPVDEFCRKLTTGQHFITSVVAGPKLFLIGNEQQLKGLAQIRLAEGARQAAKKSPISSR